jgi:hypothetical protein
LGGVGNNFWREFREFDCHLIFHEGWVSSGGCRHKTEAVAHEIVALY